MSIYYSLLVSLYHQLSIVSNKRSTISIRSAMAGRSMRPRKPVDYSQMSQNNLDDSTDDEEHESEIVFPDEAPVEDTILSSSDEKDNFDEETAEVFCGSDGTEWTSRVPRAPLDAWRFSLKDFKDGPKNEAKVPGNAGLTKLDVFKMMIGDETTKKICAWTNKYAHFCVKSWNQQNPTKKPKLWRDVSPTELRGFFGLILLGGVEKPKKKPWSEMWSTDEKYRNPAFAPTMSRDRYNSLMSALRFDDAIERHRLTNLSTPTDEAKDKFQPIREIFEEITTRFEELYTPAAKLCIDEQLVRFRGKCPFRVYLPSKPGKYGIKVWAIVDNVSGYILKLIVYTGKEGNQREVGLGKNIVLKLVKPYEESCRGVIADNFFTSLSLVKELISKKLTYCGTLRKNKTEVPPYIRTVPKIEKASTFLFNEDNLVTLVRHNSQKSNYVLLLSSAHYDDDTLTIHNRKGDFELPVIIDYYNSNKFGVDTADQKIGNYSGQYPCKRWPMKLLVHLLDCVALNAFIIWTQNDPLWNNAHKSSRRKFIRELCYELIIKQMLERAATVRNLPRHTRTAMKIMGVEVLPTLYRPRSSPKANKPEPTQGRCSFDEGSVRQRKSSRRKCTNCKLWICEDHWNLLCPTCIQQIDPNPPAANISPNTSGASDE